MKMEKIYGGITEVTEGEITIVKNWNYYKKRIVRNVKNCKFVRFCRQVVIIWKNA
jgi:predicted YcjX-like family ATPase